MAHVGGRLSRGTIRPEGLARPFSATWDVFCAKAQLEHCRLLRKFWKRRKRQPRCAMFQGLSVVLSNVLLGPCYFWIGRVSLAKLVDPVNECENNGVSGKLDLPLIKPLEQAFKSYGTQKHLVPPSLTL
jgi:hypothetical protein